MRSGVDFDHKISISPEPRVLCISHTHSNLHHTGEPNSEINKSANYPTCRLPLVETKKPFRKLCIGIHVFSRYLHIRRFVVISHMERPFRSTHTSTPCQPVTVHRHCVRKVYISSISRFSAYIRDPKTTRPEIRCSYSPQLSY